MTATTEAPADTGRSRKGQGKAAASAQPAQRPTKRRRRPALVGLGLALIGLGALAMVYLTSTIGQTVQVLAVSTEVARGETIEATDLVAVDLPNGPTSLAPVAAADLDAVVGQTATADLLPGSLLTSSSVTPQLGPESGTSTVGVSVTQNQMPGTALRAGDTIRIVDTPTEGGEPPVGEPETIEATVVAVHGSDMSDRIVIDVEVPADEAAGLAARVATGRVAVVIDPTEG
jgi:hypothetical protein